jgi:hypothetical protein
MKTPEENNAALIELLEQVIADVREHGAITAKWTIDTEDCGATPYRYRIDAVIDRDVNVTVDFPFWQSVKPVEVHGPSYGGGYDDEETPDVVR